MGAGFAEFNLQILGGYVAIVAGETIVFGHREVQKPRFGAGLVRRVAILATVCGNCRARAVRPGIWALAIPDSRRGFVNGKVPILWRMTVKAERRPGIVLDQEFAELIVVGIVTGGALELRIAVKPYAPGERAGVF